MRGRVLVWACVTGLLVLTTRWLVYALVPSPLASRLAASAGGPRLVVVTIASLGLAAGVSAATLSLAVVGVRERQRLRPERELPRVRMRRLALRAFSLSAAGALGFALLESYLHRRAGMGFHGVSCLVGPVHRNALPLVAALSLLASTLAEAVQHLRAWARATTRELLRPRILLPAHAPPRAPAPLLLSTVAVLLRARPRAPPLPA